MFRRLLSQNPRRTAATGLLALSAFYGGASDDPSHHVDVSISVPLRQLLLSTSEIFLRDFARPSLFSIGGLFPRRSPAASTFPDSDSNEEALGKNQADAPCSATSTEKNFIAKAAALASPAVVNISVSKGGLRSSKRIGSGTIIDADGTILTCAHCVEDHDRKKRVCNGKVGVTLQDGSEFEGTVVNADFVSDIAVVKIESKIPLPAAKLGTSSKLHPGDFVIALGCPHALKNTITSGIVSCVDRKSSDMGLKGVQREYLQTDCAINKGNSGGPLVNLDGEVVGVNVMKLVPADGLGFAVPVDSVAKTVEQFMKNGKVAQPWIGLKMLDLNELKIAQCKDKDASCPNVMTDIVPVVFKVTPASPADRAGFRPGDIVIQFDGKPVRDIEEIVDTMRDQVGKSLKVLVKRANNKLVTLTVVPEMTDMDRCNDA
ncbi:Trypsin [Musa troglodytarum]|uniref:Trypsin n=1 Tax=Musa troglodytarum TaxID=320322 RepID=A0A9E7GBB9_9LILI|nr:Trypsin [Musa troglodytarum]